MGLREDLAQVLGADALVTEGTQQEDSTVNLEEMQARIEELEPLEAKVGDLTAALQSAEDGRTQAQSQLQEAQSALEAAQVETQSKAEVVATLEAQIADLQRKLTLAQRMAEHPAELSEGERQVVASMSDEQWALFKKASAITVRPPFRATLGGDDGDKNQRVTLAR